MSYLLVYPIIGTLFFLVSSVIGTVLFHAVLNNNKNSFFVTIISPFIGVSLIISLFSLAYSSFISINIFIVLLLFCLFILNFSRDKINLELKIFKNVLRNSFKFFLLFFIIIGISVYYDYTDILNSDFLFYSGVVADGLRETGVENVYGYFNNHISGDVFKVTPYHYFEFWMVALFKKITAGYTSVIILKYLVYVFFKTFFVLGVYNLFRYFKPKLSFWFILIILATTYIPIDPFFKLFTNGWDIHASFWERPNFLPYLFIIVSAFPFLVEKKYVNFSLVLLFLPIVSLTAAPVVFSSNFVFLLVFFWLKKLTIKDLVTSMTITVVLAFLIMVFYYALGEKSISALESEFSIFEYFKTSWKAMIYYIVTLLTISLTPLLIFGYLNFKYIKIISFIDIFLYPFLLISSGILIFQLLFFIDNSYQFAYIGYTFLYVIIIVVIIGGLLVSNKLKYLFYVFPIIGLISFILNFNPIQTSNISLHNFYLVEKKILSNSDFSKLRNGGTALVLMGKEDIEGVLPKKRQLLTNLPFSSLLYLGDYKIIPVIDSNLLYLPLNNKDESFKKAHDFNDRLPFHWKSLDYINEVILEEEISLIVFSKNDTEMRERIKIFATDSIDVGERRILFF